MLFLRNCAFWKKRGLLGKWLRASLIHTASNEPSCATKKSAIFSASNSMKRTFPAPSLTNPSASGVTESAVSMVDSASAASFVSRFAISTCLVEMVIPVTVQPCWEARYREVPPIPQPTSKMLLFGGSFEMSRRSWIRFVWAFSFDSVAWDSSVGQYPWWMCSPLMIQLAMLYHLNQTNVSMRSQSMTAAQSVTI